VPVNTSEWEEAGLYDPDDPSADERLDLLRYLTQRGATIEQMVEAHHFGSLPGIAAELVTLADTPQVTVKELAEQSHLAVSRVLRALLAAGIPAAADTEVPADLVGLLAAFEGGAALMGDEAILAFTRVLGASAMNIAEAAVSLFFAEFGPGTEREGATELERAQVSEAATAAFLAVPDVLARMVLDQFERASRRAFVERSWESGESVHQGTPSGQDVFVALGFVDLVGSTTWAHSLSLRDQNMALSRFESAAWSSAVLAGGRVVKTIGDEVFFAAPSADAAVRIGTEICLAAEEDGLLPSARGVVGAGLAIPREGDYYGPLVNKLSRMVKVGAPGQVVVTEDAAKQLSPDEWRLTEELEPVDLRGVPDPVRAFVVEPVQAP
jgi:adenylate cyclase